MTSDNIHRIAIANTLMRNIYNILYSYSVGRYGSDAPGTRGGSDALPPPLLAMHIYI